MWAFLQVSHWLQLKKEILTNCGSSEKEWNNEGTDGVELKRELRAENIL